MKSEAKKRAESREAAKAQEARKQKEKERAAGKIGEEPCLYCGKPTLCRKYIINPEAEHELPCCSEECFHKTGRFVDHDTRFRTPFYMVLLVFVIANLLLFSFQPATRWTYLPLFGMGIAAFVCPLVFTRYERYQKFGIEKTRKIIRVVSAAVSAFALLLIICY